MEYSLLVIVSEKEEAQAIVKKLTDNNIDSFVEDMTDNDEQPPVTQWGVMIDEDKAEKAQDVLSEYYKEKSEKEQPNIDDYIRMMDESGVFDVGSSTEQPSRPSGTSFFNTERIAFFVFMLLCIGGYRVYKTETKVGYNNTVMSNKALLNRPINAARASIRIKRINDSITEAHAKPFSLSGLSEHVTKLKDEYIVTYHGLYIVKEVQVRGRNVTFHSDLIQEKDDVYKAASSELDRKLSIWLYNKLKNCKDVYGKHFFDKLADSGARFHFVFYNHPDGAPSFTSHVVASDVKRWDYGKNLP